MDDLNVLVGFMLDMVISPGALQSKPLNMWRKHYEFAREIASQSTFQVRRGLMDFNTAMMEIDHARHEQDLMEIADDLQKALDLLPVPDSSLPSLLTRLRETINAIQEYVDTIIVFAANMQRIHGEDPDFVEMTAGMMDHVALFRDRPRDAGLTIQFILGELHYWVHMLKHLLSFMPGQTIQFIQQDGTTSEGTRRGLSIAWAIMKGMDTNMRYFLNFIHMRHPEAVPPFGTLLPYETGLPEDRTDIAPEHNLVDLFRSIDLDPSGEKYEFRFDSYDRLDGYSELHQDLIRMKKLIQKTLGTLRRFKVEDLIIQGNRYRKLFKEVRVSTANKRRSFLEHAQKAKEANQKMLVFEKHAMYGAIEVVNEIAELNESFKDQIKQEASQLRFVHGRRNHISTREDNLWGVEFNRPGAGFNRQEGPVDTMWFDINGRQVEMASAARDFHPVPGEPTFVRAEDNQIFEDAATGNWGVRFQREDGTVFTKWFHPNGTPVITAPQPPYEG